MIAELLLATNLAIPQPVHKPHIDKATWALIAADASARTLDVYSTRRALNQGDHEKFLPDFISRHTATLAAYSGLCVTGDALAADLLIKHHHPRWAKVVVAVDASQDGVWAIKNLTLKPGHTFSRGAK